MHEPSSSSRCRSLASDASHTPSRDGAVLEEHLPGFGKLVLQREVVTPLDIERTTGLSEGNIFAGEFLAPQMYFFRPAPGWTAPAPAERQGIRHSARCRRGL